MHLLRVGPGHIPAAANGHQLDKAHVQGRAAPGQLGQGDPLAAVLPGGYAIHLYFQARGIPGGLQSGQGPGQLVPAGDGLIYLGLPGIQADVHPVQSRLHQTGQLVGEQNSIGGQPHPTNPWDGLQSRHQVRQVPADQGLAPGDTHPVDAQSGQRPDDLQHLLVGQYLVMGHRSHALLRHAIAAAQVAPVRHRQAQIVDVSSPAVGHVCSSSRRYWPDCPPSLYTRWMSDSSIPRSMALHMS